MKKRNKNLQQQIRLTLITVLQENISSTLWNMAQMIQLEVRQGALTTALTIVHKGWIRFEEWL